VTTVGEGGATDKGQAGVVTWAAVLVGIVAWMVHISALSSLIDLTCERPEVEWALHLLTLVTAALTLLGVWWCLRLARASPAGDGDGDGDERPAASARQRFLGFFGVIVGGFSALLILWEGSYVLFLNPCA
jgi:hypothetical protein